MINLKAKNKTPKDKGLDGDGLNMANFDVTFYYGFKSSKNFGGLASSGDAIVSISRTISTNQVAFSFEVKHSENFPQNFTFNLKFIKLKLSP